VVQRSGQSSSLRFPQADPHVPPEYEIPDVSVTSSNSISAEAFDSPTNSIKVKIPNKTTRLLTFCENSNFCFIILFVKAVLNINYLVFIPNQLYRAQ